MVRLTLLLSLVCLTGIALGLPTNDDLEIDLEHHHDHSHHDDTSDSSEEDRHHTVDSSDSSEEDRHHTVDSSDESHDHHHHDHHLSQGIDLTNGTCIEKAERLLKYLWQRYKARFGIKCSGEKERRWKGFFKLALDRIQKHNMEADMGLHSFHEGLNPLSCLSPEEINERRGLKPNDNRNSENEIMSALPLSAYPESLDWRDKGWVGPVKDQGQCGSCYTFAANAALEGQLVNKTKKYTSLSEQNLVDCSTAQGNNGCDGGVVDWAFAYVKANGGIDTEASYPYTGKEGHCRYSAANAAPGAKVSRWIDVKQGSEDSLLAAVQIGPVAVAISSDVPGFQNYKSGVFECTKKKQIDHAVTVVGYARDYWIVRNSWGCKWGDHGYIKIARGDIKNCNIAQQASVPILCQ